MVIADEKMVPVEIKAGKIETKGLVTFMEKFGVVTSRLGEDNVQVFASGTMTARSDTDPAARRLMSRAESSIRRALDCTGCGLCVAKCEVRAVKVKDGRAVVNEKCTQCGLCLMACPVVRYLGVQVEFGR